MPEFKVMWRRRIYALPIPDSQKIVLLALAEYADWNQHDGAHPGSQRLNSDTGASRSTVARALAAGIELGVIEQTGRGHNVVPDRPMASTYSMTLPPIPISQHVTGDMLASGADPTCRSEQATVSIGDSQRVTGDTLTTPTTTPTSITLSLEAHELDGMRAGERAETGARPVSAPEVIKGLRVPGDPGSSPRVPNISSPRDARDTRTCPLGCGSVLRIPMTTSESRDHLLGLHPSSPEAKRLRALPGFSSRVSLAPAPVQTSETRPRFTPSS